MWVSSEATFDYTRQRDLFDPDKKEANVTIVGLGGIGSPSALCLQKLGVHRLSLIDPDTVELHNVPNQMYSINHEEEPKAEILAEMLDEHGQAEITATVDTLENSEDDIYGIVVSGLDSMKSRKALWEMVKYNPRVEALVCARIGIPNIVIYTVDPSNPKHIEAYEEYALFDDSEAEPASCTARGIMDIGFVVGGLTTRQVRHLLMGKEIQNVISYNQETLAVTTQKWE